jgi:hypothetical protein
MEYADIYKIYCKDASISDFYIGSSVWAQERFYHHKTDCCIEHRPAHNMPLYVFIRANGGIENWTFEILDRVERPNQKIKEQEWIDKLKPTLNKRRASTDKEQAKEVRKKHDAENAEIIAQKKKEWRKNPEVKEREKQQAKEWRENNPEKRLELQREWTEKNREHVNAYANARYQANKDTINAKRRELRKKKKEEQTI